MNDLISRQAAIDAIEIAPFNDYDDLVRAIDLIERLPSAQPELKHGKWIDNNGLYQCSVCKHILSELWWTSVCPIDRMNKMMHYCPSCGAKMDEEE